MNGRKMEIHYQDDHVIKYRDIDGCEKIIEKSPVLYFMQCQGCDREIPNSEDVFCGRIIPRASEDGFRKFGCSPEQYYCFKCIMKFPKFKQF